MSHRTITRIAALVAASAALAVAAPGVALARHSPDDPVAHVRGGADDRPGDDRGGTRAKSPAQVRGADDRPGDDRGGHGHDDGAGHK